MSNDISSMYTKDQNKKAGRRGEEMIRETFNAIWNPDKCPEGVFCPKCDTWMDDYEGQPDKCPNCGVPLDGWINIRDYEKED